MSAKRKSTSQKSRAKKGKKNGNNDDLSDYDDEFRSDVSNDGSAEAEDAEDVNYDDLPDDGIRVPAPEHVGRVLLCGAANWDLYNRKTVPKGCKNTGERNIYTPSRFAPLDSIKVRVVASGCNAAHSMIITEDYKVYALGRNERGQLGVNDTETRFTPVLLEEMKNHNVINAHCGRNHTMLLTDRGTVFAMGDNKFGQCGTGKSTPQLLTPMRIRYKGPPIVKVVCGGDFSVILDLKGVLHSFGDPEYGQLGNNSTGETFITSSKLVRHGEKCPKPITRFIEKSRDSVIALEVTEIVDISCGANHCVAVDSRKRVFSWGFGGYGRLGHAEPKDELVPRLIKSLDPKHGIKFVHCGSQFSLIVTDHKICYLTGKVKNTGEANMYPKPLQDLYGWNVRSIGAGNTSVVLAADNSVISFGCSPCYGELGHGPLRKSTTIPMEVKALDGIYIEQVALGQCHTLFLAREKDEEDTATINDLQLYKP